MTETETKQFASGFDDGNQLADTLQPDTVLVARYKIMAMLGGGGQGAVYQARDLNFPDTKRYVAVKEMRITTSDPRLKETALKTFTREANLLATLSHPAIPRVYDFFNQADRAYVVMEYINGSDLEELLIKTKTLPMKKILEWAVDLCDVLHYLHNQAEPIIFRDMKPANIMVDSLGRVRLIDFGIAKVFVGGKQTQIGTEGYSAPEQYKGKANPQSDIYGLGATLHHVITRKDPRLEPPFSFAERPVKQFNPEAPEGIDAILDKALQFEPEKRYQTCAEMKEDFELLRFGTKALRRTSAINTQAIKSDAPAKPVTQFVEDDEQGVDGGVQPHWTFKAEDEIRSSPTAFRDMAFVGSYDTNVWAVNIDDGSIVWKLATDGGIASSTIVDHNNRNILFGSEDFTYNAVDYRTGDISWSYRTNNKIRSTGTIAHNHVFFGSDDGRLYAIMLDGGRYAWEFDADSPIRTKPFVHQDQIVFGTEGGEIFSVALNGLKKWSYRTKKPVSSSPFLDDDNICYAGCFDNFLYAVDAENGYSHWRVRTGGPIISSPIVHENLLFVGSADGKLYCLSVLENGREKWTFQTGKAIVAPPAVYGESVYVGSTDGKFYCINIRSGKEQWSFETQGAITAAPCIIPEKRVILIGSLDHRLYALPLI